MPFWENMPYTNFHGTNQDWIIQQTKHLIEEWAAYGDNLQQAYDAFTASVNAQIADLTGDWTDYKDEMNAAFADLHDYVYNYFENLDVQDEIDHKLDEMTEQGLWDEILHQFFDNYTAVIDQKVAEQDAKLDDQDQQIGDQTQRIDVMRAEMDTFMASHGTVSATLRQETSLFAGSFQDSENNLTLDHNILDYDYIEVKANFHGNNAIQRFYPAEFITTQGASFRIPNLANGVALAPAALWIGELNIKALDLQQEDTQTVLSCSFLQWRWLGDSDHEGVQVIGESTFYITNINGIKYTDISAEKDPELTDIRVGADGKVYPTAGDAVRGQFNDFLASETVLFPITTGYISNTSGRVVTGSGRKNSDFYSLNNIQKIKIVNNSNTTSVAGIAYYDIGKKFISSITLVEGITINTIEDIPQDAYYARFSVDNDDSCGAFIYRIQSIESTDIYNRINGMTERYVPNFISGKYIYIEDGTEKNSADWKATPYIDVDHVFCVTTNSIRNTNVAYISFYDANKNYISGILPTAATEITVNKELFPIGTKYVRLCISASDATAYAYYTYMPNQYKSTLKYMCFGDSITSDEVCGIGTLIAYELDAISLGNFAHGNATCSDYYTDNTNNTVETPTIDPDRAYNANVLSNQVRNALAYATPVGANVTYTHPVAGEITLDPNIWTGTGSADNTPDIIYIAIGTNDGGPETVVVNDADTINQQTYSALTRCGFASSLRWALETLIAKFPYAQIYVVTPLHTSENKMTGKRSYDMMNTKADIIKNVCRYCSVNVIDAYANSGVSSAMQSEFFGTDGIHPVTKWRGYIARYAANAIKQTYIQRP